MTVVFTGSGLTRVVGDGDGRRTIVDGIDLELHDGSVTLLTGPSGSGKTTLLHLVSGFDRPSAGTRAWLGDDRPAQPWRTVAVVPQAMGLLPELSYTEQLDVAAGHVPRPQRAALVGRRLAQLDLVDLASRLPGETSLGQQQRLAVARALIAQPRLLVADEPTSRQDHDHGEMLIDALRAAADEGCAVLIASHDAALRRIADRIMTMTDGVLDYESLDDRSASD